MRLRITFSKSSGLRYTGHLDMQTTWERTIRRAGLPLAYTQGFHPGPKIQIASALPLGFIGRAEIVDIWLMENADSAHTGDMGGDKPRPYAEALQSAAPPGLAVLSVEQVDEAGPALQTQVDLAEYVVTLLDPVDEAELAKRLTAMLEAASLPRERRGKAYDLRPLIVELFIMQPPPGAGSEVGAGTPEVFMRLAARAGATARPEEVLDVLGIPFESTRIERIRLILQME
jgi:radical SAM-linked protein